MKTKKNFLSYNPKLKELARRLRNDSTLSEVLLWEYLKQDQMLGCDFHRQKPIDNFIVDFFCFDLMLAIEIDGDSYDHNYENDEKRQKKLESLGITFLRFDDLEIKKDIDNVLMTIQYWIEDNIKK